MENLNLKVKKMNYERIDGMNREELIDHVINLEKLIIKNEKNRNIQYKDDSLYLKIKANISNYLGFDVSKILIDDVDIFGGAVRDSISGDKINDVDILAMPNSSKKLMEILEDLGFAQERNQMKLNELYYGIHIIHEPINYVKNDIIIQIIRPRIVDASFYSCTYNTELIVKNTHMETLRNVDIRCCGVSIDNNGLIEHILNAIDDCVNKNIKSLPDNSMSNARLTDRMNKLINKGWRLNSYTYMGYKI